MAPLYPVPRWKWNCQFDIRNNEILTAKGNVKRKFCISFIGGRLIVLYNFVCDSFAAHSVNSRTHQKQQEIQFEVWTSVSNECSISYARFLHFHWGSRDTTLLKYVWYQWIEHFRQRCEWLWHQNCIHQPSSREGKFDRRVLYSKSLYVSLYCS